MNNREVLELVAAQDGVVSRRQLRAAGTGPNAIRRQVAAGVWRPAGRSALVAAGTADSLAVRSRIVGVNHPNQVLTGPSAVVLHHRSPLRPLVEHHRTPWVISATGGRDTRWFAVGHPGVRPVEFGELLVAREADAIIDLLRFLPPAPAADVAMRAVQCRRVSVRTLARASVELAGFRGVAQLRDLVLALSGGAHSEAERRIIAALRASGLTGWVPNYRIELAGTTLVIDIAFPEMRLALEFDGWAAHGDAVSFRADRRRQNLLVTAGWTVLRFTWADLSDLSAVIDQIRAVVGTNL